MGLVDRFHQTYLSHEIGHLKPSDEAFLVALQGMGLPASEVVFFDDGIRNIEAATKLGMSAHLVNSPAEAKRVLEQYLVISENDSSR